MLSTFPCIFSASSTNGNPEIAYRTGTSEVRVSFFVTDENDHLVETLDGNDFAVVDDGIVVREFRSLARFHETTLDVAVLVDASESVERRFQMAVDSVVRLVGETPIALTDHLSIITFAGVQSHVLCAEDCRSNAAQQALKTIKAEGSTPLFDALSTVAKDLASHSNPEVRQIVILFSDGNDTISRAGFRQALDEVLATGAILYAVNLNPAGSLSHAGSVLREMAHATGGQVFSVENAGILQAILAEQRAAYVVTYALPSRQKGFHSLRILPKHDLNLQFHCKRGYYYEEVR